MRKLAHLAFRAGAIRAVYPDILGNNGAALVKLEEFVKLKDMVSHEQSMQGRPLRQLTVGVFEMILDSAYAQISRHVQPDHWV